MADRKRLGQRHRAAELVGRETTGRLHDGQRVPAGLGNETSRDGSVHGQADRQVEELVCRLTGKALDAQLRERFEVRLELIRFPHSEEQPDAIGQKSARDEREEVVRLIVEPLGVIDDAENGSDLGRLREQRERREADEERIGRGARYQSESHAQRTVLRSRKTVQSRQERQEQLMRGGEAEMALRLNRHNSDDLHVTRLLYRIVQQRRLSDPGLPPQHLRAAPTAADAVQHGSQRLLLHPAIDQPHVDHDSPGLAVFCWTTAAPSSLLAMREDGGMARVAVVLGSGGARGYAHLGAVEELRSRGHDIVALSGTSMGALVGGLVAGGREQDFTTWVLSLNQPRMLRLLDPARSGGGAVSLNRLIRTLEDMVGDVVIEDLPISFTAVATDLVARREVWFQQGPLIPAIRASIAIPGLFTPAVVAGRILVDGGLLNPLPLDPTAAATADFTFAVSLQGPREPHEPTSPDREFSMRSSEWAAELRRRFGRSAHASGNRGEESSRRRPETLTADLSGADVPADLRTADVVSQSFDAMQSLITRFRLAALPPDVLVTVPLSAARTLDFHRAAELIELGRSLAATALDDAGR